VEELSRDDLAQRTERVLSRGGPRNPDVLLVRTGAGRVVVKDFAPRSRLVRASVGRWITRREIRAYRALAGHPNVPGLVRQIDALAFAVEYRPGRPMSRKLYADLPPSFPADLEKAIAGLHERGVTHLDLSHRSNVLVGEDGCPILLDFGSAILVDPRRPLGRLLLRWLRRFDRRALRKWRTKVARAQGR
jgi:RIO-like serine/threonine protein kinase